MFIYSLRNKKNDKEIYIGRTSDMHARWYTHTSCARLNINRPLYRWMNENREHIYMIKEAECSLEDAEKMEKTCVQSYEDRGYYLLNLQLTENYNPIYRIDEKFPYREEVWQLYTTTNLTRQEIIQSYGISDSLLSKIIIEHGGSPRKRKTIWSLSGHPTSYYERSAY